MISFPHDCNGLRKMFTNRSLTRYLVVSAKNVFLVFPNATLYFDYRTNFQFSSLTETKTHFVAKSFVFTSQHLIANSAHMFKMKYLRQFTSELGPLSSKVFSRFVDSARLSFVRPFWDSFACLTIYDFILIKFSVSLLSHLFVCWRNWQFRYCESCLLSNGSLMPWSEITKNKQLRSISSWFGRARTPTRNCQFRIAVVYENKLIIFFFFSHCSSFRLLKQTNELRKTP